MRYTVEVDSDLKKLLRIQAAYEGVSIKAWVSALIRQALVEQRDCNDKGQAA